MQLLVWLMTSYDVIFFCFLYWALQTQTVLSEKIKKVITLVTAV